MVWPSMAGKPFLARHVRLCSTASQRGCIRRGCIRRGLPSHLFPMRNDNAVVSIESINSRMVGNPSFTGLWKGCPSYGHDLDSDKADQISGQPTYQFGAVFALLRGSFPSGNNKHRDCSPPLGETRQFKIQTALIFMLEALRYAGQDPETLDRRAAR